VILTNGWDHNERAAVMAEFHLDLAEFEARHQAHYTDWDRGTITAEEYLAATVFYEPRSFTSDEFHRVMLAQSKLEPDGALEILRELAAAQKCLIGALNNEARESNEYRMEHFGLRPLFKVMLSSCYLGLRKPEPEYFRRALDILGRPAGRILFIDDRAENVAAAQAEGILAIRFEGAEALRRKLGELGVL
jgi:putative hydrolase of the HAD superfamily